MNKLNSKTPVKKILDMIRKVNEKNKKSECFHIKSLDRSTKEISNVLDENFQKKIFQFE